MPNDNQNLRSQIVRSQEMRQQEMMVLFYDADKKLISSVKDKILLDYLKPALQDFDGARHSHSLVYLPSHPVAKRVLLVGLGDKKKITGYDLRASAPVVIRAARKLKLKSKIVLLPPKVPGVKASEVIENIETGSGLFQFSFDDFRTQEQGKKRKEPEPLLALRYLAETATEQKSFEASLHRARIISRGVNFGRHLVDLSGRQLYPAELAKRAHEMARKSPSAKRIRIKSWGQKELEKNKYGGILAVGQGSAHDSQLIVLEYQGAPKSQAPSILVGKGITFDSGGISLKIPPMAETMKYDMAGAATALSVFKILTDLKAKLNLVCIVPSAENMPSGTAQRPGDIITMADGQTVEVLNTDAEGRLVLADALYYASTKYKAKQIIDMATLTGVCSLVVGDAAAGVFFNDEKLFQKMQKASDKTEEGVWPLPNFPRFYDDLLKSEFADMRNIGRIREAGASTAAVFLSRFIHNKTPWIHLDIAGCGWYDSPRDYIGMRGSSGVPIRLLVEYLEDSK